MCVIMIFSSVSHYEMITIMFYIHILLACYNNSKIKWLFLFIQKNLHELMFGELYGLHNPDMANYRYHIIVPMFRKRN